MLNVTVAALEINLGKNSCNVAALDGTGRVVLRRRLTQDGVVPFAADLPPCVMAMEACCGAHHLGRVLREHVWCIEGSPCRCEQRRPFFVQQISPWAYNFTRRYPTPDSSRALHFDGPLLIWFGSYPPRLTAGTRYGSTCMLGGALGMSACFECRKTTRVRGQFGIEKYSRDLCLDRIVLG